MSRFIEITSNNKGHNRYRLYKLQILQGYSAIYLILFSRSCCSLRLQQLFSIFQAVFPLPGGAENDQCEQDYLGPRQGL